MHIVVSWDISAEGQRWDEINKRLREGLAGFSWARPLSTFYVVRLISEPDRSTIQQRLVAVARSVTETVHIVLSPVMSGGRYDGYLPKDMWAKLNERSDP
jgi:hypothetical protein